jgi:hypothetical protein
MMNVNTCSKYSRHLLVMLSNTEPPNGVGRMTLICPPHMSWFVKAASHFRGSANLVSCPAGFSTCKMSSVSTSAGHHRQLSTLSRAVPLFHLASQIHRRLFKRHSSTSRRQCRILTNQRFLMLALSSVVMLVTSAMETNMSEQYHLVECLRTAVR